jgi:hypothetical protein
MTIFSMKRISTIFFGLLLSHSLAWGGILTSKLGDQSIEGVKLAKEVTLESKVKNQVLKPYLSGIRKKKIAFFWAKVYVGQIFTTGSPTIPPKTIEEAYAFLSTQPLTVISMTFLRDIPVKRLMEAFEDSLEKNGSDPKSENLKPFFKILEKGGEAKDTQTTTIVFEQPGDGSEYVTYENGKGEIQRLSLEKGMVTKLLSIWVGKPSDSGMERLHQQFLGKSDE